MANFARGLASGLESGYKLGEVLQKKNERDRLAEIMTATPQSLQGYSTEDAAQLQAIANAKDPQGNPYYTVQSTGGLGYQVQPNQNATYLDESGNRAPYFAATGSEGGIDTTKNFSPRSVTNFLGQRYGAAGPTADEMEQARYRAMSDVLAESNPAEALRMRREMAGERRADEQLRLSKAADVRAQAQSEQGLVKGGLDIESLQDAKAQRDKLRTVDEGYSKWFKDRVGDRTPTADDAIAGLQWRANKLFEAGLGDEATKATQQHMVMANQRIELQTKERAADIPRVLAALQAGDTKAAEDFYHRFVPDGANVKEIKREKDGSYTINRETLDGAKLPPTKLKSLGELDAAIRTFADPAALSKFTQDEITNNFRSRTIGIQESEAKSNKDYRDKSLGLREKELNRPTAASIIPLVNSEGKQILYDIYNDKEVKLPEGYQPAKIDTSLNKKEKDILDDAQKDRKWERATPAERARMIKDRGGDPARFGLGAIPGSDWED